MTGFEPATSSSRTKRATKLRYIPEYCYLDPKLSVTDLLYHKMFFMSIAKTKIVHLKSLPVKYKKTIEISYKICYNLLGGFL